MELLTALLENLVGVLLPTRHALKLSKVLSCRQQLLQFQMLVLKGLEFNADVLKGKSPLLLQVVVLLETGAHVSLVVLVVLRDLRLALLENFDLKATLPGPLLPQVLVKLLH